MTATRGSSIRVHIVAIVMAGGILPLALLGAWLASSSVRSGKELLRQHLAAAADRFVAASEARWQFRNSDLLLLARNEVATRAVTGATLTATDSAYLARIASDVAGWVVSSALVDRAGGTHWASQPSLESQPRNNTIAAARTLDIRVPIVTDRGDTLGDLAVVARLVAFIPADTGRPLASGSRVALRQIRGEQVLLALDPSMGFPATDEVTLAGEPWLTTRRVAAGPQIEVAVGAPLSSYVAPFTRAARIGVLALAAVIIVALVLTMFLATRFADPVERLANAADAVAAGNLAHHVDTVGPVELRRLGVSFNVMTDSLRRTLEELSQRSALAAVGEFATSLSHEVRNALTSVKVDLQRATRRAPDDPTAQDLVARALNNVSRLDAAVSGALRVARGARAERETLDLRDILTNAGDAVLGAYSAVPATLELKLPDVPQFIDGDRSALEQLFANLLFNAGHAVRPSGSVVVQLTAVDGMAVTTIADDGVGMTPAELERIANAAYTSKPNGMGLGLPIARQIAAAHGGELRIVSTPGTGTLVRVELPRTASS